MAKTENVGAVIANTSDFSGKITGFWGSGCTKVKESLQKRLTGCYLERSARKESEF